MNKEEEEETTYEFTIKEVEAILKPHNHLINDIVYLGHGINPTGKRTHPLTDVNIVDALVIMQGEESLMQSTIAHICSRLEWAIEYKQDATVLKNIDTLYKPSCTIEEYIDTTGECLWVDVSDEDIKPEVVSKEVMDEIMKDTMSWEEVSHLFNGMDGEQ